VECCCNSGTLTSAQIQSRIKLPLKDALRKVFNYLSYSSVISGKIQSHLDTLLKHFSLLIHTGKATDVGRAGRRHGQKLGCFNVT